MLLCELNADDSVEDILLALSSTPFGKEINIAGELANGVANPKLIIAFIDLRAQPMTKGRLRSLNELLALSRRFYGRLAVFLRGPNTLKTPNATATEWDLCDDPDVKWKRMVRECKRLSDLMNAPPSGQPELWGKMPPSEMNIKHAAAFLLRKWKAFAAKKGRPEPYDLGDAGPLPCAFANLLFGGTIEGNMRHQFVRSVSGDVIDLADTSDMVSRLVNPQQHNALYWTGVQKERIERVKANIAPWVDEFMAEKQGSLPV